MCGSPLVTVASTGGIGEKRRSGVNFVGVNVVR